MTVGAVTAEGEHDVGVSPAHCRANLPHAFFSPGQPAIGQPPDVRGLRPQTRAGGVEFAGAGESQHAGVGIATVVTLAAFAKTGAMDVALPPSIRGEGNCPRECIGLVVRMGDDGEEVWHSSIVERTRRVRAGAKRYGAQRHAGLASGGGEGQRSMR